MTGAGSAVAGDRPRRLVPGDRVRIVAPSGPVAPERLDAGADLLRGWDLDPVEAPHVRGRHATLPYLAGTDEERARDLQEALCDPGVAAVFAARGGYGAQRVADLLDWAAVRAAFRAHGPKALVGFSDVTALHEAFAVRAGVATLHGPAVAGEVFLKDEPTREHLRRTLFAPGSVRVVTSPAARPLVPGRARGVTLGGCLSLLAADLGTPHARAGAAGGLLLLEDVGEPPYRVDRALTQLLRAGWLDGVAGVVLGSWARCGPYEDLRAVLLDRLGPLGVPVVEEFGFGHGDSALTMPLGIRAELDAAAGTLTYDVPALREGR
ncbi:LD-carboxypeptidase [Streptomyces sp. WAC 06783]|uniref:S66 peptidase family protein n=1 Tax=Streptomyces sp. WAC 06783 TaxID=2203211 RepID=UPI000F73CCD9|nr:LD-carboxypeptidase [Streptomyces sp. WAC 06783]RSO11651.1 LD-carboxypeptidase [Streptomyces sp. WAC 06783]